MPTLPSRLAEAPLRRCDDCQLNLGTRSGDTLRAAFACPRFGKPRAGVESRCTAFVPKVAALVAAIALAGCSLTPAQRVGLVASVLIVGAVAAHRDEPVQPASRYPMCLPNNPRHACQ